MKKLIVLFLVFTMILTLISCGDKGTATKDATITLRLAILESGFGDVQKIVEKYESENTNVKIEIVKSPDFLSLNQTVLAAYQAGDSYDIAIINHVDTMSFARAGVLLPLDDLIAADDINYEDIIFKSSLKSGLVDGKQYGITITTDTRILALNKDLFEKYGQEYPQTLEGMLHVAQAMTRDGDYGYVNSMTRNEYVSTYEQGIYLIALGGQLYKLDGNKLVATIDTPEMKEYLRFNKELLKYMPRNALTMSEDDGRSAFASGNIGMYIYGPWEFNYLKDLDFELDTIRIPKGPAGSITTSGGFQLGLCAGSKNPAAAWDLFKYITTSVENMTTFAGTSMPSVMEGYNIAPFNEEKYKLFRAHMETAYTPPPIGNLHEVVSKFSEYWADVLYDKITIEEACAKAQVEVQKLLDVNNK